MSSTTSARTMTALRSVFARFGLPEELVSDNGPQFTSAEFHTFLQRNGIRHTLVPPYHPASNGAAERCVQSLKSMLLKCVLDTSLTIDIEHRLSNWLFRYRNTPHATTGRTPAELFLQRNPRTQFSLLRPDLAQDVQAQQQKQKFYHDRTRVEERHFTVGEPVSVKNHRGGKKWIPGLITAVKGPTSYLVRVMGRIRYVHVDHLLTRATVAPDCPTVPPDTPTVAPDSVERHPGLVERAPRMPIPHRSRSPIRTKPDHTESKPDHHANKRPPPAAPPEPDLTTPPRVPNPLSAQPIVAERRYPLRDRKPVVRMDM